MSAYHRVQNRWWPAYEVVFKLIRQHPPVSDGDFNRSQENARLWMAVDAALSAMQTNTPDLPEGVPEEMYLVKTHYATVPELAISMEHVLALMTRRNTEPDDRYTILRVRIVEATPVELKLVPREVSDEQEEAG
jgi:hypothetical protein